MRGKSAEVGQAVPAWNWSDQKIMSPFFWIMYSREGWKLQVSRENFESSFLISLPKSLAKYAESNSGDHRLIWSGSLELHKQTMHYSWSSWAFSLLQQTGTSRNVLASFTWLTSPLGRLFAERSGEQRRLLIQLGWFALWLKSSYGKPTWIHLILVSAVFVRQQSMGIRSLGCRRERLPRYQCVCVLAPWAQAHLILVPPALICRKQK